MGLRDKIKDALHGDKDNETHGTTHATSGTHATTGAHTTSGTHNIPGEYPGDDVKYGTTTGTGTGTGTGVGVGRDHHTSSYQNPSVTNDRRSSPVGGGIGHRQTDSGVDFEDHNRSNKYDTITATNNKYDTKNNKDPYWGAMGQGGRNSPPGTSHTLTTGDDERSRLQRKDLPLRPNEQPATSNIGGERLNDPSRGRLDDSTHGGLTSTSGGTYNTVAGAGSRDYDSRGNHTLNAVGYQNQPSGIRGQNQMTADGYDSRIRDRDMGRDTSLRMGAGAGLTGTGLAANHGNMFDQRADADSRDMGLNPSDRYQTGGGVPQSSMLDPYQTGPDAGRTGQTGFGSTDKTDDRYGSADRTGRDTLTGGAYGTMGNNSYSTAGAAHDSHMANKLDPRIDSGRDGSYTLGSGGNHQRGLGMNEERSGLGPSSTMGPGHFGPAHEGAKVMHRCSGCGKDNDISQYFRKDAVYRMS